MGGTRRVTVVPRQGLQVGSRLVRVVSGAVHYWRHDREHWPRILSAVADLGFRIVETYVPWSVHELAAGRFDFTEARDAEAFLRLAADHGLLAIVRPGPHINSELPDFGYPRRVLWDPRCQVIGPYGTPVVINSNSHFLPAPSYWSTTFRSEVQGWYDEVVPRLARLQWPDGPVISCQVDNEMSYFFHPEAFGMDYRPEAVQAWRESSGLTGPAPTDGSDDPERTASWVKHREEHQHESLAWLAGELRTRGMDRVPLFHNDHCSFVTPMDQATLEASGAVEIAGNDIYARRDAVDTVKMLARTLAGSSVLPFFPEFGSGWVSEPTVMPQSILPADEDLAFLATLLCGTRAWNFYMLADRQFWYGTPITRDGRIREDKAELYRRLHGVLEELDWWSLERQAPVLLLRNKDLDRHAAATKRHCGVSAILSDRQFPGWLRDAEGPSAPLLSSFARSWRHELERRGLDFDEGSSDAPPALAGYAAVIVEPMDGAAPHALAHPRLLTCVASPDIDLPRPAFAADASGVSLHHLRSSDGREVLGAINSRPHAQRVVLRVDGQVHLSGRWRQEETHGDGAVTVELAAHTGQVWEVRRP